MVDAVSHNEWKIGEADEAAGSARLKPHVSSKALRVNGEEAPFRSSYHHSKQNSLRNRPVLDNETSLKRRRVMSSVAVAGADDPVPRPVDTFKKRREPRNNNLPPLVSEPVPEPVPRPRENTSHQNPAILNRDKRMLGALMGHLGAARQRLDKDKSLIEEQARLVQTVSTKQQEQSSKLRKLEQEMNQKRRNLELSRRAEKEARVLVSERTRITQFWLKAQEPLRSVMVTSTTPSLTWIPNEHNDITLAMANAQCAAVDAAMMERVEEDRRFAEKLDADIEALYPGVRALAGTGGIDLEKLQNISTDHNVEDSHLASIESVHVDLGLKTNGLVGYDSDVKLSEGEIDSQEEKSHNPDIEQ